MSKALRITSEIGDLKTVVLHRPGKEVENLTPKYLDRLLFDDIPFLPAIQKEHDYFADVLRSRGVDVLYLESLIVESLSTDQIKLKFLDQVLQESSQNINGSYEALKEYLLSFPIKEMVRKVMEGVLKKELPLEKKVYLDDFMTDSYPFYLDPLPNLYFTRDPAAVIQDGISINSMMEGARKRESMFMEYVIKHHPQFKDKEIPIWSSRNSHFPIEGGDILILNKETVAIGVSARTTAKGIEKLALNLFNEDSGIKKVVAVEIPKMRAFMHLDTVFTMIDYDKFTIHPAIQGPKGEMNIFILEKSERQDRLKISRKTNLLESLKEVLCLDEIELIPCGGGDIIASAREQWNDGSNTLAVAPGVVVTYDRNYVSNELLRRHGVEVIEVKSSELARGRGGPRCMSMPLVRGDI